MARFAERVRSTAVAAAATVRVLGALMLALALPVFATAEEAPKSPDPHFTVGELLAKDDFDCCLGQWQSELEKGGRIELHDGELEIDVPGGCSLWFRQRFEGPILIRYEATAIKADGANDRVSDLNCFWMADDTRCPGDLFGTPRSGKFADYDQLRCYYVGLGGNTNGTTRFRRYIGERGNRPLLPEHDLSGPEDLLVPNVSQTVELVAAGSTIGYYCDGRRLFAYEDPEPYTAGWFAFRTVTSHFTLRHFRVYRLVPVAADAPTAVP